MCDEDYYVSGINVKLETLSTNLAYKVYGASFWAGSFYSSGMDDANPTLDCDGCAYHNKCGDNEND